MSGAGMSGGSAYVGSALPQTPAAARRGGSSAGHGVASVAGGGVSSGGGGSQRGGHCAVWSGLNIAASSDWTRPGVPLRPGSRTRHEPLHALTQSDEKVCAGRWSTGTIGCVAACALSVTNDRRRTSFRSRHPHRRRRKSVTIQTPPTPPGIPNQSVSEMNRLRQATGAQPVAFGPQAEATTALAKRLFEGPERWGWEYAEPQPPGPYPHLDGYPQWVEPLAPDLSGHQRALALAKLKLRKRLMWAGGLAFLALLMGNASGGFAVLLFLSALGIGGYAAYQVHAPQEAMRQAERQAAARRTSVHTTFLDVKRQWDERIAQHDEAERTRVRIAPAVPARARCVREPGGRGRRYGGGLDVAARDDGQLDPGRGRHPAGARPEPQRRHGPAVVPGRRGARPAPVGDGSRRTRGTVAARGPEAAPARGRARRRDRLDARRPRERGSRRDRRRDHPHGGHADRTPAHLRPARRRYPGPAAELRHGRGDCCCPRPRWRRSPTASTSWPRARRCVDELRFIEHQLGVLADSEDGATGVARERRVAVADPRSRRAPQRPAGTGARRTRRRRPGGVPGGRPPVGEHAGRRPRSDARGRRGGRPRSGRAGGDGPQRLPRTGPAGLPVRAPEARRPGTARWWRQRGGPHADGQRRRGAEGRGVHRAGLHVPGEPAQQAGRYHRHQRHQPEHHRNQRQFVHVRDQQVAVLGPSRGWLRARSRRVDDRFVEHRLAVRDELVGRAARRTTARRCSAPASSPSSRRRSRPWRTRRSCSSTAGLRAARCAWPTATPGPCSCRASAAPLVPSPARHPNAEDRWWPGRSSSSIG